jgi:signal transduction histidine kinase
MKLVDIHEGLDSTLLMLQHRFQAREGYPGIEIVKRYGNLPDVECYPKQLNQVFLNIINNAIDALEQKRNGEEKTVQSIEVNTPNYSLKGALKELPYYETKAEDRVIEGLKLRVRPLQMALPTQAAPCISIHTEVVRIQYQEARDEEQQTSEKVVIRIADNGAGMTESVQQRLFDPFFTTKQVGKGTGLGLSISYQIVVQRHGGQLYCISELGQGTDFVIEIPVRQP